MGKIDDRAIELYVEGFFSLEHIGNFFGVTRQGVKKYLNKRGVDTSKRGGLEVICDSCGVKFIKPRCYVRNSIKNYCKPECYYVVIGNSGYMENRHKSRQARALVSGVYPLDSENVVHHVNGDQSDNRLENLMVFKNQSDHGRWHRAGGEQSGVVPEWCGDGRVVLEREVVNRQTSVADRIRIKLNSEDDEILAANERLKAKREAIKGQPKKPEDVKQFFNPAPKWKKR